MGAVFVFSFFKPDMLSKVSKVQINQTSFKGYDAAPLKNSFMQDVTLPKQAAVMEQLTNIGRREGFNVAGYDISNCNHWGQDDKIIRRFKDKSVIVPGVGTKFLTPTYSDRKFKDNNHRRVERFSQMTGMEIVEPATYLFEGGNVFLGKKDGVPCMLAGESDLLYQCESLSNQGCKRPEINLIKHSAESLNGFSKQIRAQYQDAALEDIGKTFGVEAKNVSIIPQANFHLDMFLRPVGFPKVLINNPRRALQNLANLAENAKTSDERFYWSELFDKTEGYYDSIKEEGWASTGQVKSVLIRQGFIPVGIGAIYGEKGDINFINAVVNKHSDGRIGYITNSASSSNPDDLKLEDLFEQQLKDKLGNVEDVYFVRGQDNWLNDGKCSIRHDLGYFEGGLHCLVCEEPDFEAWA